MKRCRKRQRGSAALLAVLAVFALAAAGLSLAWTQDLARRPQAGSAASDHALEQARARLQQWYASHLAELDAAPQFPLAAARVMSEAGIDQQPALHFAAADVLTEIGGATTAARWPARALALWINPAADDASGFDAAGIFRPDPRVHQWQVFSSGTLQQAAWRASEVRLRQLATMAELRAMVRLRADPDHDLGANPFRASDCTAVNDELPCTPTDRTGVPVAWLLAQTGAFGAALTRSENTSPLQQPDALTTNPWGGDNRFDNAPDPGAPPYTARFATITPGGAKVQIVAVQPYD